MKRPFYPILLAVFPVLALLAINISQVWSLRGLRPALVAGLGAAALMVLFRLLLRDWDRAAWAVCVIVNLTYFRFLTYAGLPLAAMIVFWKQPLWKKNICANLVAIVSVLMPLGVLLPQAVTRDVFQVRSTPAQISTGPDIYWIILDGYTSHTVLQDRFGYDNTPFLEDLQSLGFVTSDCTSQYPVTAMSIAATLNREPPGESVRENWDPIWHSDLRVEMEARGYRWVTFETGFAWLETMDAARWIHTPIWGALSDFEALLVKTSLLGYIPAVSQAAQAASADNYRLRLLNALEHLPRLPEMPGPKFVYAHLIIPHPPFVIHADGTPADGYSLRNPEYSDLLRPDSSNPSEYTEANYISGYVDQAGYIERVLPGILEQILQKSDPDPVIIIQGDHGAWYARSLDQYAILCAVHAPAGWDVPLEPEHTFDFALENSNNEDEHE